MSYSRQQLRTAREMLRQLADAGLEPSDLMGLEKAIEAEQHADGDGEQAVVIIEESQAAYADEPSDAVEVMGDLNDNALTWLECMNPDIVDGLFSPPQVG